MSTDTDGSGDEDPTTPVEITLTLGESGDLWVARDEETGVASQGETREAALDNLDEAVALYHGETGREPTDEELREVGIDPDENTSGELPDVLQ
ncbi:type II toxin-antitoxin system HicB family antitoxin [Halosimplex pelagicum]|uniref:Type II toxin-antitoxin system HicB family antitoxin n=1 Tax=Halosimplex pelagicum TaxID=869886 RepID=A0A7D5P9V0_9EURY|nr:type II toxin-antitoxin system HicB family antitoxin [Halosimplex pelagicum]QLH80778.1 type II toxin-antitoxin system HicB family antitoxin [Halosimplex pelagicum]